MWAGVCVSVCLSVCVWELAYFYYTSSKPTPTVEKGAIKIIIIDHLLNRDLLGNLWSPL